MRILRESEKKIFVYIQSQQLTSCADRPSYIQNRHLHSGASFNLLRYTNGFEWALHFAKVLLEWKDISRRGQHWQVATGRLGLAGNFSLALRRSFVPGWKKNQREGSLEERRAREWAANASSTLPITSRHTVLELEPLHAGAARGGGQKFR